MADQYNLVDNMISEMNQNNSPDVLNYSPQMGQGAPMGQAPPQQMMMQAPPQQPAQYAPGQMPPQQQVRMGEVQYVPPSQQQAPTMQTNMQANMEGESMVPPEDDDQQMMMDAPDLSNYGMEEDNTGMVGNLIDQSKGPLIVVALAFLMSLPQVSGMVRNLVARFTTNPMYVNVLMAVLMGAAFYLVNTVL
jgi:hypothetical protein